jgi:stage V sporulation protein B
MINGCTKGYVKMYYNMAVSNKQLNKGLRPKFIKDAAGFSIISVALRAVALGWNIYLSGKLGAEGMGLMTLAFSVYGFASTIAHSGVGLAAVRLSADSTALGDCVKLRRSLGGCLAYSLCFSTVAFLGLFLSSAYIGGTILADARTIAPLRIMSAGLIPISLTSALSGYFTGVRKIWKNALCQCIEMLVRIGVTSAALNIIGTSSTERSVCAVVGGSLAAELFTLTLAAVMFVFDYRNRVRDENCVTSRRSIYKSKSNPLIDVAHIALPVATASYARSALLTVEHIAVPWGLRKTGKDASTALSSYGALHGMALPVLLFPAAITGAISTLLVPETAEANALGDRKRIAESGAQIYRFVIAFATLASSIFFTFAYDFGSIFYSNAEVGTYIRLIAPIVPVMYLDSATDAMLKGLGQQVYSMIVNIIDAAVSVVLVVILVPAFGITGYLITIIFGEILNAILSIVRLLKITDIRADVMWFIKPAVIAAVCSAISFMSVPRDAGIFPFVFEIVLTAGLFVIVYMITDVRRKVKAGSAA